MILQGPPGLGIGAGGWGAIRFLPTVVPHEDLIAYGNQRVVTVFLRPWNLERVGAVGVQVPAPWVGGSAQETRERYARVTGREEASAAPRPADLRASRVAGRRRRGAP